MGTRSAPRAKSLAKRAHRLKRQQFARRKAVGNSEIGGESATSDEPAVNVANQPSGSPAQVVNEWVESAEELTPIKQVAAAALILGQNVSKTASALGVDRRTIQRWRKLDPDFQLAMVETRQEVIVSSRQRILLLSECAVDTVETQLNDEQNARVALALLRSLGVVSPAALDARQYEPVETPVAETSTENEFRAQSATSPAANSETADPTELTAEDEEVYEFSTLSAAQQVGVQAFYVGKSLSEVAAVTQCSEACVRGWLCQDRHFFTVLSALQFERIQHLKYRILALIKRAMHIVEKAIEAKDGRIALALLRGLGFMR
jgi:hypothetical protein